MNLKKQLEKPLVWSVMLLAIFLAGFLSGSLVALSTDTEPPLDRLPSLKDIQRRVGALPDGVYGNETKTKWDRAICDQHAVNAWKRHGIAED